VDRLVAENGIIAVDQCNGVTRAKLFGLAGAAGAAGGETNVDSFSLDRLDEIPAPPSQSNDRSPQHLTLFLPPHRFPTGFLGSSNRAEVNTTRHAASKPSMKMIDHVETDAAVRH